MNLITSESRERNAFLENTQAELELALGREAVIRAFGQTNIAAIKEFNELLFIPDIKHGEVKMPEAKIESNAVPYWALAPGESAILHSSMLGFAKHQREVLAKVALNWWGTSTTKLADEVSALEEYHMAYASAHPVAANLDYTAGRTTGETVSSQSLHKIKTETGEHIEVVLDGRPMVILRDERDYPAYKTLFHELIHVGQVMVRPDTVGGEAAHIKRIDEEEDIAHKSTAVLLLASTYDAAA